MRLAAIGAIAQQAGLFRDAQVRGDGRLRDPGPSRQGAYCLLAFAAQAFENGPPARIGGRPELAATGQDHPPGRLAGS